jgi:hypothetical protein
VRSHEWIDRRSRALHEAVASRLEAAPHLLAVAQANVARWMASTPSAALREWQVLLEQRSLDQIISLLRSDDETAARLRQSSPFAGVLTPAERQQIMRSHDSHRA